ncbi:MAG: HlyC/CorC family transporter [Candidatus Hydrogenedentes bacterium]|nr:HlyC/CorC family transporter [Candidatus Hydrogenedentota bacterium]
MMTGLLLFFVAGVMVNAFFAGYETGYLSCNPIRVRNLAEKNEHPNARRLLHFMDNPERMLTLVLVGTNLALVAGTIALTKATNPIVASAIATLAFLVFGEVVPKSMFRTHPTRFSLMLLPLISFFDLLLAPLVAPLQWLSVLLIRWFPKDKSKKRVYMQTEEDVRVLVNESADQGTIEQSEREMIHNVMDLQRQNANEAMIPRINIKALPESSTRKEVLALFVSSGHTRVPIFRDSIDYVVGEINAFDVLRDEDPENQDINRFIKPILHVPDTMKLDDVLRIMRDKKQSTAIVTDEYGGTDGLITLEDILEEIFGEIHDEYDKTETPIRRVGPDAYVIDARTELETVAETIGMPIVDEEVETIGGWVMRVAGRIPERGAVIEHAPFRITILSGGANYLSSIRLEVLTRL